jgi:hypothetical protein
MWRWVIGIILLMGLSIPVIALATDNTQPPAPTPVRQDALVSQARVGQPRLAFDEHAKLISFDDRYPFVQTFMITDVVDIALDSHDKVWGAIDKQQRAMVWYRYGYGNIYTSQYGGNEYCNNTKVHTLALSWSQAGCIYADLGYLGTYLNPEWFSDVTNPYPEIADYIYYHAVESEWGSNHGLVLTEDGTLWPVGYNTFGQANVLAPFWVGPWPRSFDAGDTHSIAARADGSVLVWGGGLTSDGACLRTIPAGATNVVKVAAGAYHNLALRADGTVVGWGGSGSSCVQGTFVYPAESNVPNGLTNIVDIAAGDGVSAALKADGTVYVWGSRCVAPTLSQPLPPCTLASKLSGIVKIQVASLQTDHVHVLAMSANPVVRSVMRCVGSTTPCTTDPTLPISGGRIMITGEYLRNTLVMLDNKTIRANMITYDSNNTMYVSLPAHVSGSANLAIIGSNNVPVNVTVRYSDAIATLTNTMTATRTRTSTSTRTSTRTATSTTLKVLSPTSKSNGGRNTTATATRTVTLTKTATATRTVTLTRTTTRTKTATMTRSATRTGTATRTIGR